MPFKLGALFCHKDGDDEYVTVMLRNGQADVFGLTDQQSGEDTNNFMLRLGKNIYDQTAKMFKLKEANNLNYIFLRDAVIPVNLSGSPSQVVYKKCAILNDVLANTDIMMISESENLVNPKNMAAVQNIPGISVPNTSAMSIKRSVLVENLKKGTEARKQVDSGKSLKLNKYQASDVLEKALLKYVDGPGVKGVIH